MVMTLNAGPVEELLTSVRITAKKPSHSLKDLDISSKC